MKVKELIERLQQQDPELEVLLHGREDPFRIFTNRDILPVREVNHPDDEPYWQGYTPRDLGVYDPYVLIYGDW